MIAQGEGGEQGDPLMPLLFSLGQHAALAAVNARLQDGERLFAYLIHVISSPCRVLEVHRVLQEELWAHARIRIHHGKTQLWNRGGSDWDCRAHLCCALHAVVWKSDPELPLSQNGLRVLGGPIGHPLYIVDQLDSKSVEHELLFQRIPAVGPQAAWLLLLLCGATLGLATFLHVPTQLPHARTTALMPLSKEGGGFGQCCASPACCSPCELGKQFAHVRQRHPDVADTIITGLERDPALC